MNNSRIIQNKEYMDLGFFIITFILILSFSGYLFYKNLGNEKSTEINNSGEANYLKAEIEILKNKINDLDAKNKAEIEILRNNLNDLNVKNKTEILKNNLNDLNLKDKIEVLENNLNNLKPRVETLEKNLEYSIKEKFFLMINKIKRYLQKENKDESK